MPDEKTGDDVATPDQKRAAEKRAAEKRAAAVREAGDPQYVAALLREREGYVIRGLTESVAEVDAELARWGHSAEPPVTPKPRARK